jgi:hypothetical protein
MAAGPEPPAMRRARFCLLGGSVLVGRSGYTREFAALFAE